MDLEVERCMDVVEEAGVMELVQASALWGEAAAWVGVGEDHQQQQQQEVVVAGEHARLPILLWNGEGVYL